MPDRPKIGFTPSDRLRGVLVTFCAEGLKFGPATQKALSPIGDLYRRAAAADRFTGKSGSILDIIAPTGLNVPRLVIIGTGKERELRDRDLIKLGGVAMGRIPAAAAQATILAEFAGGALKADQIADLALGARLRGYRFDRYKTKCKEGEERADKVEVNFACGNPAAAEKAWARATGVADGVVWARDLINEPANVLYPGEFARRASGLRFSTCRRCGSSAWARSSASGKARRMSRRLSSCAGTPASAAPIRLRSSAKACASTAAASRSSRRRAWKT
jgi:leucyl aminopeptidase